MVDWSDRESLHTCYNLELYIQSATSHMGGGCWRGVMSRCASWHWGFKTKITLKELLPAVQRFKSCQLTLRIWCIGDLATAPQASSWLSKPQCRLAHHPMSPSQQHPPATAKLMFTYGHTAYKYRCVSPLSHPPPRPLPYFPLTHCTSCCCPHAQTSCPLNGCTVLQECLFWIQNLLLLCVW